MARRSIQVVAGLSWVQRRPVLPTAHHRGQAHALLSAINGNERTPSFDLIIYQRETGEGLLRNRS